MEGYHHDGRPADATVIVSQLENYITDVSSTQTSK